MFTSLTGYSLEGWGGQHHRPVVASPPPGCARAGGLLPPHPLLQTPPRSPHQQQGGGAPGPGPGGRKCCCQHGGGRGLQSRNKSGAGGCCWADHCRRYRHWGGGRVPVQQVNEEGSRWTVLWRIPRLKSHLFEPNPNSEQQKKTSFCEVEDIQSIIHNLHYFSYPMSIRYSTHHSSCCLMFQFQFIINH